MPFADKTLTCADCGQQFVFSADDQEFFASRGFGEPKRCRSCRAIRRNEREGGASSGGGTQGYATARAPRQMFDAVCGNCGQPTQVPFQPRGDRPVYCRDCFSTMAPARPASAQQRRY